MTERPGGRGRALRLVALGGGHGLGAGLSALRRAFGDPTAATVSAVVTVADNGGSSGRLRGEFPGALPLGDLRMALAALCPDDSPWVPLLQHRFSSAGPLDGHSLGNLMLLAAAERAPDPVTALAVVAALVGARGQVLPMSSVPLDIEAEVELRDGSHTTLRGQAAVAKPAGRILQLRLDPAQPPACAEAVAAITEADGVLLGPGSWFTSVLVHLLVPELAAALVSTGARLVVALNTRADRETAGLPAADHLTLLHRFAPALRVDAVVADPSVVADEGARATVAAAAAGLGAHLVVAQVARRCPDGTAAGVHDPAAFGAVLRALFGSAAEPAPGPLA